MKRLAPEAFLSTPADTPAHSYAIQPIIDTSTSTAPAYEALLRGSRNEPPTIIFRISTPMPLNTSINAVGRKPLHWRPSAV